LLVNRGVGGVEETVVEPEADFASDGGGEPAEGGGGVDGLWACGRLGCGLCGQADHRGGYGRLVVVCWFGVVWGLIALGFGGFV